MTEDRQELYRKFTEGLLTKAEKEAFENRLASDLTFKEDFNLYQSMEQFLDDKVTYAEGLAAIKEVGQHHQHSIDKEGAKIRSISNKRRAFMMAASIAFLVSFGGYFVMKEMNKPSVHQQLVDNFYERPANQGTRSLEAGSTALDSAIYYFDLNDFDKSETLFTTLPISDTTNRYLGHIYFIKKDLIKSNVEFSKILNSSAHKNEASYMQALIAIANNEKRKATVLINEIPNNFLPPDKRNALLNF